MPKDNITVVEDIAKLSDVELLNLLLVNTKICMSLITDWKFNIDEFKECIEMLKLLQQEIELRHKIKEQEIQKS